jgi:hypothetical protein
MAVKKVKGRQRAPPARPAWVSEDLWALAQSPPLLLTSFMGVEAKQKGAKQPGGRQPRTSVTAASAPDAQACTLPCPLGGHKLVY